ncbi:MAG: adenosylcobinamide-GDP ribazoletransferase [Candidatus Aminicenantes bacterium]|jgi:adenosylcobinamide-GDP ribazoletransferase
MMKNIAAAFQFLTILPVPVKTTQRNLEKSILWFPLVGAIIGLITGYGYWLLNYVFTENISSVLTILIYIFLTRALHLDGFMDTIDGFFSHKNKRDKEFILKIMKDPTVGSFAVLGVIIWFLLLFSVIPHLEPKDHVMIHTYTRMAILVMPLLFSYPRESGTGKFFADHVNGKTFCAAITITLVIMAVTHFINGADSLTVALVRGALLLVALLISGLIGTWSKKKINGITGDILGFTIETIHLILVLLIILL